MKKKAKPVFRLDPEISLIDALILAWNGYSTVPQSRLKTRACRYLKRRGDYLKKTLTGG